MKKSFYVGAYCSELSFSNKLIRFFWSITHSILFKPSPIIFFSWRALLLRAFGAKIEGNCKIYPTVKVWLPSNLRIGEGVIIGNNVELYNVANIIIDSEVTISQNSYLCTASHNIESASRELVSKPIEVGNGAWIFANTFISLGVTVNKGAIIAAGSLVVKDVKAFDVVGGNPARFIKKREANWLNS